MIDEPMLAALTDVMTFEPDDGERGAQRPPTYRRDTGWGLFEIFRHAHHRRGEASDIELRCESV